MIARPRTPGSSEYAVHLWATEIWRSHGGVQRFMQLLIEQLQASVGLDQIVTLLDGPEDVAGDVPVSACCGAKPAFLRSALMSAATADIVIIGHPSLASVGALARTWPGGPKYLVVLHGREAWGRMRLRDQLGIRMSAGVVATTTYTLRRFTATNAVGCPTPHILPLAVDCLGSGVRHVHQQPATEIEGITALSVSRLVKVSPGKGLDHAIMAAAPLLETGHLKKYVIVGDGEDRPRLTRMAADLAPAGAIEFPGSVDDQQIREAYMGSDVFILPSGGEGFGIVYLEAMCAGMPIIASDMGAAPHVLRHGVDSLVVPYGDVRRIRDALVQLASDRELRNELGAAARRRVETVYSLEAFRSRLATIIQVSLSNCEPNGVPL